VCPARRYCNVDRGTHFAIANARTDLYPSDLYSKIASFIIVSVYASISRKVAIVVGLHVDVQEQLQFLAKFPTSYVISKFTGRYALGVGRYVPSAVTMQKKARAHGQLFAREFECSRGSVTRRATCSRRYSQSLRLGPTRSTVACDHAHLRET
jgi:hypothetical protein